MALHLEALASDVIGGSERRVGVAAHRREHERAVAARRLEQQAFAGTRRLSIEHRRQRLDIQRDRRQRVLSSSRALCHHQRHRLADIADLLLGDHRLQEGQKLGTGLLAERDERDGRTDFGGGDDRDDAR